MFPTVLKDKTFLTVLFISLFIAVGLTAASWDMNFWPTDAEEYYMPAAKELPSLKHLSQINQSLDEERVKWLHGKEMHVLAISWFQRLTGDTRTLRPLLLLGVTCIFFSSLLIFLISRRLWGRGTAAAVWFLFTGSFWPYLYVLFVKHQTQGLLFFLLSVFFILRARSWIFYLLAGLSMGVSVFSSTVSFLYLPFIVAALIYVRRNMIQNSALFLAGLFVIVMYANYPDITGNLKSYWQYIHISGKYNHFFYNQRTLAQWLPHFDLKSTRGGWVWVFKYFCLVMPVVFPLYIASAIYVLRKGVDWRRIALVALSFVPPLMAEIKGVAQYGANYFPSFIGMLMLIGCAHAALRQSPVWRRFKNVVAAIAVAQVLWNVYVFTSDVYPCRMATTLISRVLEQKGIQSILTFPDHPLRRNIVDNLNPATLQSLKVTPIASVIQAPSGYILLPPVSTDTIYRASNGDYNDFDEDLVLNQIVRQHKLADYAVASFKTLGSSLIWGQEEEILAHRYLVLNQFQGGELSKAWILDAAKIRSDRDQFLPTEEDLFLYRTHVRNIGTRLRQTMYTGFEGEVGGPASLKGVTARMFKMGHPQDSLRAFVFKVDEKQPMWLPYAPNFVSQLVAGASISDSPAGSPVIFIFDPPLQLDQGPFYVEIYRTSESSDADFYRIYADTLSFWTS